MNQVSGKADPIIVPYDVEGKIEAEAHDQSMSSRLRSLEVNQKKLQDHSQNQDKRLNSKLEETAQSIFKLREDFDGSLSSLDEKMDEIAFGNLDLRLLGLKFMTTGLIFILVSTVV